MRLFLPLLIPLFLAAPPGHGDDYKEAIRLRESREILPLEELMSRLDLEPDARILEIESELEHGRRVYEIEYLSGNGRIREVLIDARTGEILADEEDD